MSQMAGRLHAGEHRTEQRDIRNAPGKQTHGVERGPKMANAPAIKSCQARFIAHDATERGGQDRRSACLRAESQRNHVICNGGGGTARGYAGTPVEVVRVPYADRHGAGEFRRLAFSEDHHASATHQANQGGIHCRLKVLVDRRAIACRHVEGIEDVLDADRDAMQPASTRLRVASARLAERSFGIEIGPAANIRLARNNSGETIFDDRDRCCLLLFKLPR